jgi:hypothetical protein
VNHSGMVTICEVHGAVWSSSDMTLRVECVARSSGSSESNACAATSFSIGTAASPPMRDDESQSEPFFDPIVCHVITKAPTSTPVMSGRVAVQITNHTTAQMNLMNHTPTRRLSISIRQGLPYRTTLLKRCPEFLLKRRR